jgi:hypothetical protein
MWADWPLMGNKAKAAHCAAFCLGNAHDLLQTAFAGWVSRIWRLPGITPLGMRRNPPSVQRALRAGGLRAAPLLQVAFRAVLAALTHPTGLPMPGAA